jgi:hypothetical protein
LAWRRWSWFGGGFSTSTESSIKVLERLLETDFRGIELPHRRSEPVLGEMVRLDAAGGGDQFHGSHRWPVVAVGDHVDVGVRESATVEGTGRFRQAAVRLTLRSHELAKRVTERQPALRNHDLASLTVGVL